MGNLALVAKESGYRVTGHDKAIYPPMSRMLADAGIEVLTATDPQQLVALNPDEIIIGNALSRGHPFVEHLLDIGLPLCSGPEWLYKNILAKRKVIAVAGTHGKTTLTAMLAWILSELGEVPGYLIGGVPHNFKQSASLGKGSIFVLEADEYDTAFFDKRAKFLHYHPQVLIINNLEYDHADIYPNLAAIQTQFHHLLKTIAASGHVIYPSHNQAISDLLAKGCWSQEHTFSHTFNHPFNHPFNIKGYSYKLLQADASAFLLFKDGQSIDNIRWSMLGEHNIHNLLAGLTALDCLGIDTKKACQTLTGFQGVKRRLEHIYYDPTHEIRLYNDFAHHPSAILATLQALRNKIGRQKLIAIIVPASNTMRLGQHKNKLQQAIEPADFCLWLQDKPINWTPIADTRSDYCTNLSDLAARLQPHLTKGTHLVLMTNGESETKLEALRACLR